MRTFLVFPVHLFQEVPQALRQADRVILLEEPVFFYDPVDRPIHAHPLKCAFHRASLRAYHVHLKKHSGTLPPIEYVPYEKAAAFYAALAKQPAGEIVFLDPVDTPLVNKLKRLLGKRHVLTCQENTQAFLATRAQLDAFHRPSTRHDALYRTMKQALGITELQNVPSQDADNRRPLRSAFVEKLPRYATPFHAEAKRWWTSQRTLHTPYPTDKTLDWEALHAYPVTHADARKHLAHFLQSGRFRDFGPYQDAIHRDASVLNHAHISALLNCGLLTPHEVLQEARRAFKRQQIPLQSFEGFVRQLIGWREYMRYIYVYHYDHITTANALGNQRRVVGVKDWYAGTTGIAVLDHEIRKAMRTGYAHHIVRLMIFLNIMTMAGVRPADIVHWFMEVVSMDAYDWVMWSNVVAMGGFSSRFMRKPYISTSNYARTLSNYPKSEADDATWDALFYYRIYTSPKVYGQVYGRNLAHFRKKYALEPARNAVLDRAKRFLREKTRARDA